MYPSTTALFSMPSITMILKWWVMYCTTWNVTRYGVFSGPYFPVFGLNAEMSVNLRIQSEYRKTRTRKNSVFWHFSHSVPYLTGKKVLLNNNPLISVIERSPLILNYALSFEVFYFDHRKYWISTLYNRKITKATW